MRIFFLLMSLYLIPIESSKVTKILILSYVRFKTNKLETYFVDILRVPLKRDIKQWRQA